MSDTYDPILAKEDLPRLRLFRPRPTPEPGIALVLFAPGQRLLTLWPGHQLTAGEVRWGNYQAVYKVDITEHILSFDCTLPCEGDAFDFQAQVRASIVVNEPKIIVERNVRDAVATLKPLLFNTMRRISRRYDVENSADAEQAIMESVRNELFPVGLQINRFVVDLSLDADAREHIRTLREIDRTLVKEQRTARLTKQRTQQELDDAKTRMDFYNPLIQRGEWELLGLQLARNPGDLPSVINLMNQQRQAERDSQLQALRIMLEEDALEGFQIEEAGKRVLQRFVSSLERQAPAQYALGATEDPALPDLSSTVGRGRQSDKENE